MDEKGALFMLMWKKVYFDLDNTLYSHEFAFEKAIQDCYQDVVEEWEFRGMKVPYVPLEDWFDVFKYFSDYFWPLYEHKELSQREYRRKRYISTMEHFKLPCNYGEADHFHQQYYEKANLYVQPFPGLYHLLQYLMDQQVEIGIITNGRKEIQLAKLQKLKLLRYIELDHVFISGEVGIDKPDPALFQLALGEEDPNKALFIGDTWEHDVVGSIEAGWRAIYLNSQGRPRSTEHRPIAELFHFTELLPLLKQYSE
jgi:5'-nucleotidase